MAAAIELCVAYTSFAFRLRRPRFLFVSSSFSSYRCSSRCNSSSIRCCNSSWYALHMIAWFQQVLVVACAARDVGSTYPAAFLGFSILAEHDLQAVLAQKCCKSSVEFLALQMREKNLRPEDAAQYAQQIMAGRIRISELSALGNAASQEQMARFLSDCAVACAGSLSPLQVALCLHCCLAHTTHSYISLSSTLALVTRLWHCCCPLMLDCLYSMRPIVSTDLLQLLPERSVTQAS